MENDIIGILGQPTPEQIARFIKCTGIERFDQAKDYLMSDDANQFVGRNQGNRNK